MRQSAITGALLAGVLALLAASVAGQADPSAPSPALAFVAFNQGLPTSGQWREGFRIADMNEDGHPDIVHGARRGTATMPSIFLGDGKGGWTRWKELKLPELAYDYGDVEVADFNRDGHPDLALAMHYAGIQVLLGDGRGGFTNASTGLEFGKEATFTARALRAIDWNGDGLPDLVALSEGPRLNPAIKAVTGAFVFLNQGTKGWKRMEPGLSRGNFSDSLTVGDFDGDGHNDFATGSMVMGRTDLVNLWRPMGATPVIVDIPSQIHYVQAVAAGDFDSDGKDDLAVAYLGMDMSNESWYSELDVYFARAGGKWERRMLSKQPNRDVAVALRGGHLRSKSALDLVALTTGGDTLVYLGDGHGKLALDTGAIPNYGHCRGAHVELADLDGDGRDEIVASFSDEPHLEGCRSGGGITAWKPVK